MRECLGGGGMEYLGGEGMPGGGGGGGGMQSMGPDHN